MNHVFALYGKKCINILEPSSGGNGTRLNTPSPILTCIANCIVNTIKNPTFVSANPGANFPIVHNTIVNTIAIKIFIKGPANATMASCADIDLFLLKLVGFISTGFPHPKCTNISIKNPIGSICANGFNVSLF